MQPTELLIYTGLFLSLYFGIFIFITFFENKKRMYNKDGKTFPFISMIVPCYNEEDNIEKAVLSLKNADYPKEKLQIIVIDDGSTDQTLTKIKTISGIEFFHKENGGKFTALNYGIQKSKGELIGCLDADCMADRNSLKKIVSHFTDPKVSCVVSTIKIDHPKNILEGIQCAEYLISAFLKKNQSFLGSLIVTPGPLSIFRKETLKQTGPYKKAHMTEDLEMALRMQSKNLKIVHALDSIVYTKAQPKLVGLCRQRLRWRRGFLLNLRDYKNLLDFRKHGNLSLFLFYNIFGALLSISLVFYTTYKIVKFFASHLNNALLVNFDYLPYLSNISFPSLHFNPAFLLGVLSLIAMLLWLFLGKKLTFDKINIKEKAVFYVILYSFLNTLWWILASFSIIFKKEVSWK